MACPWETAIHLSVTLPSPQDSVDYLTRLSEIVAPYVSAAPTQSIPCLPPPVGQQSTQDQPNNGQRNRDNRQNNIPNNRFQDVASDDDDDVEVAQHGLANLHLRPHAAGLGNPGINGSRWSAEDIYIQIITTLGEMLGKLALHLARDHKWAESADRFTQSARLLTLALQYADMMYARVAAQADLDDHQLDAITERVRRNAEAVGIAAAHGVEKRDQFERMAESRKRNLENQLTPQWQDRDSAKARMGEDAWTHNPQPKGDFARRRAAAEKELRELEAAMTSVHEVDFSSVRTRAEALRNRA
jgi:hypothetical protein